MSAELQVAFISGPAYDPLYATLPRFEEATGTKINVAFTADHPSLNHHLASLSGVPYDLVSTHTKYAPSQLRFLAPLSEVIAADDLEDFVPLLLKLAQVNGELYGLPRNIDVRLLHYRTDLIDTPPQTWDELFEVAKQVNRDGLSGFLFPGRESGLFGTFFELAEMAGAQLFLDDFSPDIENDAGRWALNLLQKLYKEGLVPAQTPNWHYDKVHECFRAGHAAMVGDWPGYYGLYKNPTISAVHDRFAVSIYPKGPAGRSLAYGGGHTFALTRKGASNPDAIRLLKFLTSQEQQLLEARNGCVPVRQSVMRQMQSEADDENQARLGMLEQVIAKQILIPPKFENYPQVEDVLWHTVRRSYLGEIEIDQALRHMTKEIQRIVNSSELVNTVTR